MKLERPPARVRAGWATVWMLLLGAGGAAGQGVTGTVRDSLTAAPLSGVLISVLDPGGQRVRGVLSDDAGRFSIELPLGRYALRAERIGLTPRTTERFDLDTFNPRRQDIMMSDRAVEIAGLVVDSRVQSCAIDPVAAVRIQRWWQEIRTALDVSSVLQREEFAYFEVEKFQREWGGELETIVSSSSRVEVSQSSRPFASAGAAFLADGGFVQGDLAGEREYYAPDADVLLSDVFLSQHCFSLTEEDAPAGQLGVHFEPVPSRAQTDIIGTLWVDTTTAELQSLEYSYANVEGVPRNRSGGLVAFDYLDSGAWIVSEWYIRMPKLGIRETRRRVEYVVLGYVDVGGEVTLLSTGARDTDSRVAGSIRGMVFDSIGGGGLVDATVEILGTRQRTRTDAAGGFILTNVPVGRHQMTFYHDDTEAWGLGSTLVEVEVQEGLTSVARLAVPSFRQAALSICRGAGADAATVLVGHFLGPDRVGLPSVELELTWLTDVASTRMSSQTIPARTGTDGRFVVCTIPGEARVGVRARIDGDWVDAFDVALPIHLITYREVWFRR